MSHDLNQAMATQRESLAVYANIRSPEGRKGSIDVSLSVGS